MQKRTPITHTIKIMKTRIFLDSGAFSALNKKTEVDMQEYIAFIKANEQFIEVYANLDVIGDAEATLKNQQIMEAAGLRPLPVFHSEDDFSYLHHYVKNYDYIALGGMAGKDSTTKKRIEFLDRCFEVICDTPDKKPKCKVHGFGLTENAMLFRYPWYSVDSTTWVLTSSFGCVFVPRENMKGEFIYDKPSLKICVSNRSGMDGSTYIDNLSDAARKKVIKYFASKGFTLGKSAYKTVDKGYKLKENERALTRDESGKPLEVEAIEESGLSNDHVKRSELNILYSKDMMSCLPEWPWSFESKKKKKNKFFLQV